MQYLAFYFWFFLISLVWFKTIKAFKCCVYFNKSLSLYDIWLNFFISAISFTLLSLQFVVTDVLACIFYISCYYLIWFDALLFRNFSFALNLHGLKIFFQGGTGFGYVGEYAKKFMAMLSINIVYALLPLFVMATIIYASANPEGVNFQYYLLPLLLLYAIICITKTKIKLRHLPLWVLIGIAIIWLWRFTWPAIADLTSSPTVSWVELAIIAAMLLATIFGKNRNHPFFSSRSFAHQLLQQNEFKPAAAINLEPADKALIQLTDLPQQTTPEFGCYQDANIIFIFLESIGANYLQQYTNQGANLTVLDRLKSNALWSKQHVCLSPNTTEAIFHAHAGAYNNTAEIKHLQQLHQSGYQSIFLGDSFQSAPTACQNLLRACGYQHILQERPGQTVLKNGDYILLDAFDRLLPLLQKQKYFLQIFTTQTHAPYPVIDKAHFSRHTGQDERSNYLNAIEESDFVLNQLLDKFEQQLDLSNTIIIVAGDHGESFGQLNYHTHSNSTSMEQIWVPFLLYHPKLHAKQIDCSCHFDIFPTLFNYLGIQYNYKTLGMDLNHASRKDLDGLLFYAKTRQGNAPSQFSLIKNDQKYLFDLIYQYHYQINMQNDKVSQLDKQAKAYWQTIFYNMLNERGLVGDHNIMQY